MKDKFIKLYMDWAERTSKLSHAKRLQVGAVIVKDDSVISYGYNGMPAGWDNDCEDREYMPSNHKDEEDWPFEEKVEFICPDDGIFKTTKRYRLKTKPEVLHAESNAIAKLAKSNNSGLGADLFVTHAPCMECAKLIFQSGISRVYYSQDYRDDAGIKFLKKSKILVKQLPLDEL
jgi:dCMP deaminase